MITEKPSQNPSDLNNSLESSPDSTNSSNLSIVSGLILWMNFEEYEEQEKWYREVEKGIRKDW